MRRSEVERWLDENGGQKNYKEELVKLPNPKYPKEESNEFIYVKQVTWVSKDGPVLVVRDNERRNQDALNSDFVRGDDGSMSYDPDYDVVSDGDPNKESTDNRSPESKENDEKLAAQRRKNEAETGRWETDDQRRTRERDEERRAEEAENKRRSNELEGQRIGLDRERVDISRRAEDRAAAAAEAQAQRDKDRLDFDREKYDFERDKANRPSILGTPTEDNEQIASFDPTTGQVAAQANPLYNRAKAEAKRLQEELALAIQMNKMSADEAAAQYTRWFKENVEVPFLMAAEARAQSAEKRQALEAEERKRQFAASHELQRAQIGQRAAGDMLQAEMALNPYRVGPAFGEQMSSAINSLAAGGKMDANASAGINFTADAFEYKKPDLEKIARKATKNALKGLTPYDPGDEVAPTADYSNIPMPTAETMMSAPAPAQNPLNIRQMFDDWRATRYSGPTP